MTFDAGKAVVVSNENKIGLIDKDGKYIVTPQFDDIARDYLNSISSTTTEWAQVISNVSTQGQWRPGNGLLLKFQRS